MNTFYVDRIVMLPLRLVASLASSTSTSPKLRFGVLAVLAALACAVACVADTRHVPADYSTIQAAIDASSNGDEIIVAAGTYKEEIDFLGKAIHLHSADGAKKTTIDAWALEKSAVTCVSAEGPETKLEGFTIRNGRGTTRGRDYYGGGMINDGSSPTVVNCVFVENHAFYGGAMYNLNSSPTVDGCTFDANTALVGDGVYNDHGSNGRFTNCTFQNHSWSDTGGGFYNRDSSPTLFMCIFSVNQSGQDGQALYNISGNPSLTNCLFWSNGLNSGNTVYVGGGQPTFLSCTFADGLEFEVVAGEPSLTNCIVWSRYNGGRQIDGNAYVIYSDVKGGYAGVGNINADPRFVDPSKPDFRLKSDSPCINVGTNAILGAPTDLDGQCRVMDGKADDTETVDMGAFEVAGPVLDCDGDGVCDLQQSWESDCNHNFISDGCDIARGFSLDEYPPGGDGIPDDCERIHNVTQNIYFQTIQSAIDVANDGDEVILGDGRYFEAINLRGKAIYLHSFHGADATAISGAPFDTSTVTCASGEGAGTVLEGLTLRGGTGTPDAKYVRVGGGMLIDHSSPTIRTCAFTQNAIGGQYDHTGSGGGIFVRSGSPLIENCSFSANAVKDSGGGICVVKSAPTISACAFSGNAARSGGGISTDYDSAPEIENCTFDQNTASGWEYSGGGGISAGGGLIRDCTFSKNSSQGAGGGISTGYARVRNCTFSGNKSKEGAGIACGGDAEVSDCVISGNSATSLGGGASVGGHATLQRCIVTGNSAPGGAGIVGFDEPLIVDCVINSNSAKNAGGGFTTDGGAWPKLVNCTIVNNSATSGAGVNIGSARLAVSNSIIWGNSAGQIAGPADVSYSDVQGGFSGTGNIQTDPKLVDPSNGDFHLAADSPCIDAGTNAWVRSAEDADGNCRVTDGDANGSPIVDMGAFEFAGELLDCNGDGVCDTQQPADDDCNQNLIPDDCDIASGLSLDVYPQGGDGVPDECERVTNVTQDTHYAAIQPALDAAVNGDDIIVLPGTYFESIGVADKAISLRSTSGPDVTTIDVSRLHRTPIWLGAADGPVVLEGFTIRGGDAGEDGLGGGMFAEYVNPTIINCVFTQNVAANGGGVAFSMSDPLLVRCVFRDNTALYGAGWTSEAGAPTLIDCTFMGNIAVGGTQALGGAMFIDESKITLINCTFARNRARNAGALGGVAYVSNKGALTMTGCTVTKNSSVAAGGAVYVKSGTAALENCIVWSNNPDQLSGSGVSVLFSDVQGGYAGTGNIDADPIFVDPVKDNYRLAADSPCIDSGENSLVPADITTDFDGRLRIWDGNADGAATVDMGVYEAASPFLGDLNCDGALDFNDVDAFVTALIGRPEYEHDYPGCNYALADINADGAVDFNDIDPFVDCLINNGCP